MRNRSKIIYHGNAARTTQTIFCPVIPAVTKRFRPTGGPSSSFLTKPIVAYLVERQIFFWVRGGLLIRIPKGDDAFYINVIRAAQKLSQIIS